MLPTLPAFTWELSLWAWLCGIDKIVRIDGEHPWMGALLWQTTLGYLINKGDWAAAFLNSLWIVCLFLYHWWDMNCFKPLLSWLRHHDGMSFELWAEINASILNYYCRYILLQQQKGTNTGKKVYAVDMQTSSLLNCTFLYRFMMRFDRDFHVWQIYILSFSEELCVISSFLWVHYFSHYKHKIPERINLQEVFIFCHYSKGYNLSWWEKCDSQGRSANCT